MTISLRLGRGQRRRMPSIYGDTVRRLQAAVEKIGSSRVYLLSVHASEEANRTLGDAAQARH